MEEVTEKLIKFLMEKLLYILYYMVQDAFKKFQNIMNIELEKTNN
jgi:hypothetical protein